MGHALRLDAAHAVLQGAAAPLRTDPAFARKSMASSFTGWRAKFVATLAQASSARIGRMWFRDATAPPRLSPRLR